MTISAVNLINKTVLCASIAGLSALSLLPAHGQENPSVAPARTFRISPPGVSTQPQLIQSSQPTLNGSVSSATTFGASRLGRPQAVNAGMNSFAGVNNNFAVQAAPQRIDNSPLVSAADQAAFSQVQQPAPVVYQQPAASSIVQSSASSFDAIKALQMGANIANQVGRFYGRSPANQSLIRGAVGLAQPAFVGKFSISKPLTAQELSVLSTYDVVLVLDKSGSMDEHDCPGGMSRWDWCRDQMFSLTSQISSVFRNGITVALYSSDYEIFRNVDLNYVTRIFGEHNPSGATFTGKTVDAVLNDYFARRSSNPAATRRLLVQVVTDGDPSDKGILVQSIVRATQQIKSQGEITINFLQIGNEQDGARTLAKLDNDMIAEGAQFDIVKVEPFARVALEGLPRALVDATR